jgi:hypothetical protein
MGSISAQDARNLYTKAVAAVYKERTTVQSFLRSFFPSVEKGTKEISIEVQRGFEKIAVDVVRGTEGNRNQFGKSTEKIFVPPLYKEYFDVTQLDSYDKMFGDGQISINTFDNFVADTTEKLGMLQDKIERRYELQCAQVLETGIVTLNAGTNIDFKRKALSKVDLGSGNYWTTGTNSPYATLKTAAEFLRTKGKSQGGVFNVIMGESALGAFLTNAIVLAQADVRNFGLDAIREPQRNAVGSAYHGRVSAGSWVFDLWTYPEYYTDANGNDVPYMNTKNIVVIPQAPKFQLTFAAVPQLISMGGTTAGAYKIGNYVDERNQTHIYDICSAGVAIPVAVDQIYTAQVVA